MRRTAVFLAVLLGGAGMGPSVAAHGPGTGTVSRSGTFVLTPSGTLNASFHAYLASMGLPIGPGDVLVWSWSANSAVGPPIYFEIHAHPQGAGYVQFLNVTADAANRSWTVPGSDLYMVYWVNSNAQTENVTYSFQLVPPPLDLWPLYLSLVAPIAMIGALISYSRRKSQQSKT